LRLIGAIWGKSRPIMVNKGQVKPSGPIKANRSQLDPFSAKKGQSCPKGAKLDLSRLSGLITIRTKWGQYVPKLSIWEKFGPIWAN
jgi:hypothetical protein